MRSSSAAVAWTSAGCREAIDGLGGQRRPPLMVVQPHWQNGSQRYAKLVKHYASCGIDREIVPARACKPWAAKAAI